MLDLSALLLDTDRTAGEDGEPGGGVDGGEVVGLGFGDGVEGGVHVGGGFDVVGVVFSTQPAPPAPPQHLVSIPNAQKVLTLLPARSPIPLYSLVFMPGGCGGGDYGGDDYDDGGDDEDGGGDGKEHYTHPVSAPLSPGRESLLTDLSTRTNIPIILPKCLFTLISMFDAGGEADGDFCEGGEMLLMVGDGEGCGGVGGVYLCGGVG